ncbi:hypothetical protein [Sphingosinicella soli]|uniref:DUF3168 domain-containing protein n=1 Tax=Sphingosinicella soli TaxID=333708 RepID=A0A7W7B423_9SPHN|nr:hypothetical protein [Sphingosinicella soli]MBB4633580.1 hypothetical protein [Sphingosinicella soli]
MTACQLMRTVTCRLRACAGDLQCAVETYEAVPWASATFEGQRHAFTLRIDGNAERVDRAALRVCGVLLDSDIDLSGELLADLVIIGEDSLRRGDTQARRLHFEALTVRD